MKLRAPKLRSNGRHGEALPAVPALPPAESIPTVGDALCQLHGLGLRPIDDKEVPIFRPVDITETRADLPVIPLPKRRPFADRCRDEFRPGLSAALRADFRDLPAFRATVRDGGLRKLHLRAPAGPRTEKRLP